ncbi:MAG: hypothetical protein ACREHG_10335, partial [Candidatus Saccharimonadales bacterium]
MYTYYKKLRRLKILTGLSALALLITASGLLITGKPAMAAGSGSYTNASGVLIQSYSAGPGVLPAMLVQSEAQDPNTVIPLTYQNIGNMLGVVLPANSASIVLTPQYPSKQQVLVAASGRYDLLVSNQNGAIKSGDYLSVSAIPGIAMKADSSQKDIIGRSEGGFNGSGNVIGTEPLQSTQGKISAAIGYVPTDIQLGPNPLLQSNG